MPTMEFYLFLAQWILLIGFFLQIIQFLMHLSIMDNLVQQIRWLLTSILLTGDKINEPNHEIKRYNTKAESNKPLYIYKDDINRIVRKIII